MKRVTQLTALLAFLAFTATIAQAQTWPCYWASELSLPGPTAAMCTKEGDTLTVSGTGYMRDYAGSVIETGGGPWNPVHNVVIGADITYIGKYAFQALLSNFTITVNVETPPAVGEGAFQGISMANAILRVPHSSIDAYREADVWKDFGYINPSVVTFNDAAYPGPGPTIPRVYQTQLVSYGDHATRPEYPAVEGYKFEGWRLIMTIIPEDPGIYWDFDTDVVTSDITLVGKWTPSTSVAPGNVTRKSPALASVSGRTLTVSAAPGSKAQVRVTSLTGRTVARFNTTGSAKVSLKAIPAGAYIIEAKSAAGETRGAVSQVILK